MAKEYLAVDTSSPEYPLVEGTFFNKFDCFSEFIKIVERIYPGLLNFEIISERVGQKPRREVLIKCSFKQDGFSNTFFYVYVCPIEGGGRYPTEQRIQFNPSNRWNPNLHNIEIAHKFLNTDDKTGVETYVFGIYKTSENDNNIVLSGLYPSSIETTETDNNKTSTSSYQIRIESIQRAYQTGIDLEITQVGTIINFTPNNLFWYMINRDNLHLDDLKKISELVQSRKTPLHINRNKELGSLQQIFYGAPGTGKSFTIDNMADDDRTVRTTFHPDSDYASFVGAYKPTMEDVRINSIYGESVQFATGKNGHPGTERKIVYKYVPQAFLKAYVEAWKDLDNPHYLVIEEINRGNCAQIFGDLFQLLDRNAMGCSSYAIHADDDIRQFLASDEKGFGKLSPEQIEAIRSFVFIKDNGSQKQIGEQILNGEQLLLPPNLYIWATMNTSDQSLFPIDSAFKRRWNWKFVPINYEQKNWLIHIGDSFYRWGDFLKQINPIIFSLTESSDKQMGYFFAKPDEKIGKNANENNTISEDIFLNKVLFYIWTDILKDFDAGKEPFINPETGRAYEFSDFFKTDKNRVVEFITKSQFGLEEVEIDLLDMDGETPIRNGFKVLVNGITFNRITSALHQILLVKANEYTYDGLKSVISNCINRDDEFIKTIPTAIGYERESGWYGKPLTSSDNISFIITNQWNKSFIPQIKKLAETLGVTFEELGE